MFFVKNIIFINNLRQMKKKLLSKGWLFCEQWEEGVLLLALFRADPIVIGEVPCAVFPDLSLLFHVTSGKYSHWEIEEALSSSYVSFIYAQSNPPPKKWNHSVNL